MADPSADPSAEQIPRQVQMLFNKGFSAFERGNHDVAIDLLSNCLRVSPGFKRARKFLRAAQVQRLRKSGKDNKVSKVLAELKGLPAYLKTATLLKSGKNADALVNGEKMLGADPFNRKFVHLFARVAESADQIEAASLTLETARESYPDDPELARHLGKVYERMGSFRAAKECYEKLLNVAPNDAEALKLLKDAMARESMDKGWDRAAEEEGVTSRDLAKDQEQTRMLDLKGKAVKSADDTEQLIEETRAKIMAEPRNINFHRSLARLLTQQKRFDEALESLDVARQANPNDPELDRMYAQTRLQGYDHRVAALREEGKLDAADALEQERAQYAFDDLVGRVERYPNDLHLRYELGMQYFKYEHFDDAIQQFQVSQRNPKDRVDSLYHLGMCFRAKGQNDMALMQLEQALEMLPTMDDQRKEVVYAMGELAEASGDAERASKYFKEIYQVDIAFRDVSEKVEKVYAAIKKAQDAES